MNLHLQEKRIIVTGGAKGIGRGIVNVLAEEGALPLIIDKDQEATQKTLEDLKTSGYQADAVHADLTDPEQCKQAVSTLLQKHDRIDGLVNNAGINDGASLESATHEAFMQSLHKNVVHYFIMAQACLPQLKANKGAIVNITSKVSLTGQGGTSGYAAANGGRNALTREWAVDLLPYGVRVNAVVVAECMTPLYQSWLQSFEHPEQKLASIEEKIPLEQRMTTAEELGQTVAFLLSSKSSHTTGQLIHVDGGYTHLDRAL
jgi:L-fucose dehydrogenase